MFDFIFQALYSYYEKKEKGGDSVWTASLYVSIIEYMVLCSFLIMLDILSQGIVSMNSFNVNKTLQKVIFLSAGALLYVINLKRYRRKKGTIIFKFKNHPANRWFRVWMIVVLMFLLVFSPVLWIVLRDLIF